MYLEGKESPWPGRSPPEGTDGSQVINDDDDQVVDDITNLTL